MAHRQRNDGWDDPAVTNTLTVAPNPELKWLTVSAETGDGQPWDAMRVGMIVDNLAHGIGMATLIVGRYLLWAKKNLGHGEFRTWLLARGLPKRNTARMMRLARLFDPRHQRLIKTLSIGKLWELYDCQTEELTEYLREFETSGQLAGKELDEIDRMPINEVRATLRRRTKALEKSDARAGAAEKRAADLSLQLVTPTVDVANLPEEWRIAYQLMKLMNEAISTLKVLKDTDREGALERCRVLSDAFQAAGDRVGFKFVGMFVDCDEPEAVRYRDERHLQQFPVPVCVKGDANEPGQKG